MGKYTRFSSRPEMKPRPWRIHPIWRGIGCVLFIIGPFIAFSFAHYLVEFNIEAGWLPVPSIMARTIIIPFIDYPVPHFYGDLLTAAVLLLIGFAVIMMVYSVIFAILGPSKYGPLDSPPIRVSPKKRRRK